MHTIFSDDQKGHKHDICCEFIFDQQYVVEAQTSLAPLSWFHGSRVTTAHVHQCCIFQSYAKTVPSRMNEIDYAWTSIHDNGHVVTACDVWLQQRICHVYSPLVEFEYSL